MKIIPIFATIQEKDMIYIESMTFNTFQENTFVVNNDNKETIIFDPGCSNISEQEVLSSYIERNKLNIVRLVNTHCHIDHVLGNQYISDKYAVTLEAHLFEKAVLDSCEMVSKIYNIAYAESPEIASFINEDDVFQLGNESFQVLLCPGHSPGSLCFYHAESKIVIGGDVLFQNSIGRTDLPGGDYNTLINSIKNKLFKLPDDTRVYCGHGPSTTIGLEKKTNPFLI